MIGRQVIIFYWCDQINIDKHMLLCIIVIWDTLITFTEDPVYTRPPADGSCPISSRGEDWIEYGDYCYLFMEQYVSLSAARLECNVRNQGELASVHSDEESAFIGEHIKSPTFNGWWWIGLVRAPGSKWTFGYSLVQPYFIQVERTQKRIGCGVKCDITLTVLMVIHSYLHVNVRYRIEASNNPRLMSSMPWGRPM